MQISLNDFIEKISARMTITIFVTILSTVRAAATATTTTTTITTTTAATTARGSLSLQLPDEWWSWLHQYVGNY